MNSQSIKLLLIIDADSFLLLSLKISVKNLNFSHIMGCIRNISCIYTKGYNRNTNHEICEDYIFWGCVKIILQKYLLPHQSTYFLVSCLFLSLCFLYSFPMAGICKQRKTFLSRISQHCNWGDKVGYSAINLFVLVVPNIKHMKKINEYSHIVYSSLQNGRVQKTEMIISPETQVGLSRSKVGQWALPEKARFKKFH